MNTAAIVAFVSLCLWREARNQGIAGLTAVACVIHNRAEAWYKGDLYQAIVMRNQFSSMTVLGDSQTVVWPILPGDLALYQAIFKIVDAVRVGTQPDVTTGALYYANLATMDKGGWFAREILGKPMQHKCTGKIEQHTFFM